MKITSATVLLNRIQRHRLLKPVQYAQLVEEIFPATPSVTGMIQELLKRGWLTPFQAQQVVETVCTVSVGPYLLMNRLGGGGGSHVFQARDTRTGQVVALKVLQEAVLEQEENLVRFRREILAAMGFDHPNIVRAVDGHLAADVGYLAMEYLPGVDLLQVLNKVEKLDVPVACEYARQAALGLQHIHEHGLIHRDVKPGNLLITRHDPEAKIDIDAVANSSRGHCLKLLDLGLVRTHHFSQAAVGLSVTAAGSLLGTPDYMAPEQARNPKDVDIRADIYALGCTLYHLLTGRVPFPGGAMMRKLIRHQTETVPTANMVRREVPDEVARLIDRMMAKSPGTRPATPDEVARTLAPFCESERP